MLDRPDRPASIYLAVSLHHCSTAVTQAEYDRRCVYDHIIYLVIICITTNILSALSCHSRGLMRRNLNSRTVHLPERPRPLLKSMHGAPLVGLVFALPCCVHSFLLRAPAAALKFPYLRNRTTNKKWPSGVSMASHTEASVDAQAMQIIAELKAGTKTL